MPLIQPTRKIQNEAIRLLCPMSILSEVQQYCTAFHIEKQEDFFIQAARFVLQNDKDWARFKKSSDSHISTPTEL